MRKLNEERRMLAERNIGLAHKIACGYRNCAMDMEEIDAAALFGLVKAASVYDASTGFKFATVAAVIIRNEILMELRKARKHSTCISMNEEQGDTTCTLADLLQYDEPGFTRAEEYNLIPSLVDAAGLSPNERQAVLLIICMGGRQADAGRQMGVSQSYVGRCARQGIKKIRNIYFGKIERGDTDGVL
ncbi:MAG: sigma-70 family RNA polymerase sigma factor [Lachnospiraceae bacterium]|nr:sigma-70 family RNA polymerase sigma factor [Lachnospiraceae bacterium]